MNSSFSARLSADLLDLNYERWLDDPRSVDPAWSAFFEGFELGVTQLEKLGEEGRPSDATVQGGRPEEASSPAGEVCDAEQLTFRGRVVSLVYNYRTLGHTQAHINPLDEHPPPCSGAAAPKADKA